MDDDDDINGVGLLSGPPPDPEQVKRAEAAEALRRQQEAAAARREAEIQETCDQIDAFMSPLLKAELELENAKARVSRQPRRFLRGSGPAVQAALPAPPQAVAVFLTDKDSKLADIEKLAKHISLVHRAVGLDDPCEDILIRALLRQAREEKKSLPKKGS